MALCARIVQECSNQSRLQEACYDRKRAILAIRVGSIRRYAWCNSRAMSTWLREATQAGLDEYKNVHVNNLQQFMRYGHQQGETDSWGKGYGVSSTLLSRTGDPCGTRVQSVIGEDGSPLGKHRSNHRLGYHATVESYTSWRPADPEEGRGGTGS